MAPQAGGYYVYARRAFGDVVGFAVGWTDWLTYCAVLGYASIGMAEFAGMLTPALAGAVRPVAIVILIAFVGLQWAGIRVSSRFQEITTALKFLAFFALVVAALALSGRVRPVTMTVPLPPVTLAGVIAAVQAVVITYGGWQSALYFTEEDRDPSRNLPRAMIGGVLAVIVIYTLVNIALLVPAARSRSSRSRRCRPRRPPSGSWVRRRRQILTVISIVSLPPLLNAIMMIGTRILFALGRDGLFFARTASVNAGGTPDVATIVTTIVAVGLIATGTFQRLIAMASFFLAANYCICCLALFALRRREPERAAAVSRVGLSVVRGDCPRRRGGVSGRHARRRHDERARRDWTRGRRRRAQANDAGSSFTQNVKLLPASSSFSQRVEPRIVPGLEHDVRPLVQRAEVRIGARRGRHHVADQLAGLRLPRVHRPAPCAVRPDLLGVLPALARLTGPQPLASPGVPLAVDVGEVPLVAFDLRVRVAEKIGRRPDAALRVVDAHVTGPAVLR